MDDQQNISSTSDGLPSSPFEKTQPAKQGKLTPLNIALIVLLAVGIVSVAIISILKSSSTGSNTSSSETPSEPQPLTPEEIYELRLSAYASLREIQENDGSSANLQESIDSLIKSSRAENGRRSLRIYNIYLRFLFGKYQQALEEYNAFMSDRDSLSQAQICELSEYRLLVSEYIFVAGYDSSATETDRVSACANALSEEDYIKKSDETELAYATRLYISGFLTDAVTRFKQVDSASLSREELNQKYTYLIDFYASKTDREEYYAILREIEQYIKE